MTHFQKILALTLITMTLNINARPTPPPDGLFIDGQKGLKIDAWSWGASQSGSFHSGGGGGSGKGNFQDISLSRLSDSNTAMLIDRIASGQHMAEVILRQGNVTIVMTQVMVTSVFFNGATNPVGNGDVLRENVTLNFAKFNMTIDGSSVCWDIALNTACR
jgi:type VI secretion system secreted protein Hcp